MNNVIEDRINVLNKLFNDAMDELMNNPTSADAQKKLKDIGDELDFLNRIKDMNADQLKKAIKDLQDIINRRKKSVNLSKEKAWEENVIDLLDKRIEDLEEKDTKEPAQNQPGKNEPQENEPQKNNDTEPVTPKDNTNNLYGPYGPQGPQNHSIGDYEFHFDKKPEDYIKDQEIPNLISDMVDKYYGNKTKEIAYNEALKRIQDNKGKIMVPGTKIQADGIRYYPGIENDLKLTQLESYNDKAIKLARYNAGDKKVYANADEKQNDEEYIKTNNFAYDRTGTTKNNLKTLGKYGEKYDLLPIKGQGFLKGTTHALLNVPLAVRNVGAVIYRAIGKPVSWVYGKVSKQQSGIYSNKAAHRFEARKDYFFQKECERMAAKGKTVNPFLATMKARRQAIFKYKEGNKAVLEAGYKDIKESYINKAKANYFSDKLTALEKHRQFLENEKANNTDPAIISEIEKQLQNVEKMKNGILTNPKLKDIVKNNTINAKDHNIVQTDAISINQHDRANKATVTRTITGVKILGAAGVRFLGPKIEDWMLENAKIPETRKLPNWTKNSYGEDTVQTIEVNDYVDVTKVSSEEDLLEAFSIKNLMRLDKKGNVSFGYDNYGSQEVGANLDFFRGAAQKINGRTVSISDGNGYDITKITSGSIPTELLENGSIKGDANLFDILAALQKQAGNDVSSQDLINQVLSCGSKEEQAQLIQKMSEGLDFWKSTSDKGIATGWDSTKDEILKALNNVKTETEQILTGTHMETKVVPGEVSSEFIKGGIKIEMVDNPRIVKALGLNEKVGNGMSIADAITAFFENIRMTKSKKANNKQYGNYEAKPEVGFTGYDKQKDKKVNDTAIKNDFTTEIEDIER